MFPSDIETTPHCESQRLALELNYHNNSWCSVVTSVDIVHTPSLAVSAWWGTGDSMLRTKHIPLAKMAHVKSNVESKQIEISESNAKLNTFSRHEWICDRYTAVRFFTLMLSGRELNRMVPDMHRHYEYSCSPKIPEALSHCRRMR